MNLRQARLALGWSQPKLAAKSGVRQQTISELERDTIRRASHDSVVRIVTALQRAGLKGVTADDLFPVATKRAS